MIDAFVYWLLEELANAGSSLFNLSKRVSIFYLVSAFSVASALFYFRYGVKGFSRAFTYFSPRIWWHSSSRTDYALWLMNRLLFAVIIPKALTQAVWISWLFFFWQEQGLSSLALGWPDIIVVVVFTLCYFLADDFTRFFVHWCMHKSPFLWVFHQVHHSATVLNPFTVFRTHPVEGLLFFFRSLLLQSTIISVFLVLFPHQVSLVQVFGVLITTFVFNTLGANLRHSGVALSYGEKIEKWFISPAQHQIHHSNARRHYDRNFGVILAIWDRAFGSWLMGNDDQAIQLGTGQPIDHLGLWGQYIQPVKDFFRLISYRIISLCRKLKNSIKRFFNFNY